MNSGQTADDVYALVRERLVVLEHEKESSWQLMIKRCVITVGLALVVGVAARVLQQPAGVIASIIVGVAATGLFVGLWFNEKGDLETRYKNLVVGTVLSHRYPQMGFSAAAGMSKDRFQQSGLFPRPDSFASEDGFGGRIGSTEVMFSEVHTQEKRGSGKNTRWVTTFRGLFLVADFHKHLHGSTRVLPDVSESMFGSIGKAVQGFRPGLREQLVHLENPQFEHAFKTLSTDQVEARYILSPAMMERILRLRTQWQANLRLSFQGSLVFVAIDVRSDLFEPKARLDWQNQYQLHCIVDEVLACCQIVDELDLNTRIWTKD